MKKVYGDPPYLIVPLYMKVFGAIMLITASVFLGAMALGHAVDGVDMAGMTVTAPVLAYLIHLWLMPPGGERA